MIDFLSGWPQRQKSKFRLASEADSKANGSDATPDPELGVVLQKVTVEVVATELHFRGCVIDQGHPALASVSVSGELEAEGAFIAKVIKDIRLMNESEDRVTLAMVFPGAGDINVSAPDGVQPGKEDSLSLDGKGGAVVFKVRDSGLAKLGPELSISTVPTIVIAGGSDDSVLGFQLF